MSGSIRFVFTLIWLAIGLGTVGTLKDCTASMGKDAATAHRSGGISYRWWNRALLDGKAPLNQASHISSLAGEHEEKNKKRFRGRNPLSRSK